VVEVGARETASVIVGKDADGHKTVNQYTLHEVLGRGSFGKVRRVVDCTTGKSFAMKIMKKAYLRRKRVGMFGNMLEQSKKEVAIWKKLRHPNVVSAAPCPPVLLVDIAHIYTHTFHTSTPTLDSMLTFGRFPLLFRLLLPPLPCGRCGCTK
jgi:serine/threonine protein kinase